MRAVLLYGPDASLVRERMVALTKAVAGSVDDPFRTAEFPADVLKSDPARLGDEAAALALTGGRRAVRFRDAADVSPRYSRHGSKVPKGDGLVIVTAGELTPRAKIRVVFEEAELAAAVPCYTDDADALARLVRETLKGAGL